MSKKNIGTALSALGAATDLIANIATAQKTQAEVDKMLKIAFGVEAAKGYLAGYADATRAAQGFMEADPLVYSVGEVATAANTPNTPMPEVAPVKAATKPAKPAPVEDDTADDDEEEPAPKAKKAKPAPEPDEDDEEDEPEEAPKSKRGRPAKAAPAPEPPKAKRGRPAKQAEPDDDEEAEVD